jgi:hypothetical protein
MPTMDQWDDWSMEQHIAWLRDEIEAAMAAAGARAEVYRSGTTEIEWRGMLGHRPMAIQVDDDGDIEVRMRMVNRRGYFCLGQRLEGVPALDTGAWTDPTDMVQHEIDATTVLRGLRQYVEDDVRAFESLPAPLRQTLIGPIASGAFYSINVTGPEMEWSGLLGPMSGHPVQPALGHIFGVSQSLAEALSQGDTDLPPRSSVVMGGQVVSPAAERSTCAYCQTTSFIVPGKDPRCPGCGAMPGATR